MNEWQRPLHRGAGPALTTALTSALPLPPAPPSPRSCPARAARLARSRELRFCPDYGAGFFAEPVCSQCGIEGEPGGRFCGQRGERLPAAQPPRHSR